MAERGDGTTVVTTGRLVVRPWRLDEADRFFDMYRRPEVVRWLGAEPMQDRGEAIAMIERNLTRFAADSRFGAWAVVARSTGVAVGSVILKPLPDGEGEVEIGWQLHPDSWGKGFASEAASAVLDRGFSDGLPEVWAVTCLDNARSVAVCGRIGMSLLGITHRWHHEPSLMAWDRLQARSGTLARTGPRAAAGYFRDARAPAGMPLPLMVKLDRGDGV